MHNILWGFGGKLVDEKNNVAINSKETIAAIEYMRELTETFVPGVAGWSGVSEQQCLPRGQYQPDLERHLDLLRHQDNPIYKAVGDDMDHAPMPMGRSVARPSCT